MTHTLITTSYFFLIVTLLIVNHINCVNCINVGEYHGYSLTANKSLS